MPRLFLGNFDFEHELAGRPRTNLDQNLKDINRSLASTWLAIAEPDDLILVEDPPDRPLPHPFITPAELHRAKDFPLTPWGWTPAMVAFAEKHNLRAHHPPLDVVRRVNSRQFRFQLEQEFNIAPDGATEIHSLDQLTDLIDRLEATDLWILKANYGMSGRERLTGRGPHIPPQLPGWTARRLKEQQVLIFEPLLKNEGEIGVQFDIPESGDPQLIGLTGLVSSPQGGFSVSYFGPDSLFTAWHPTLPLWHDIARRVQAEGYFGPLGLDAMRYKTLDDEIHIRPLQDLNVRFTMGRLALGWRRLLEPDESAMWSHGVEPSTAPHSTLERMNSLLHHHGRAPFRVVISSPDLGRQFSPWSLLARK
ncbi:MAG: hypothetical protein U0903_02730 [Planctomycetales bacterium]